ncbi:ABC transporter substrate-binding protein [Kitasatospora sp. NPDC088548]|uniref:ABC transporter substrate-binding protein n=1 Tax=Kitasatospora sp. NPDC088548 TaxID=3364075 RepID=UPI00381AA315
MTSRRRATGRRRAACTSAVAAAVAVSSTACGGGASAGGASTVVVAIASDPGSLSPLTTLAGTALMINRFAYDPLVHSAADGSMAPGVAETWSVEGGTARFTLREGVTCEDGSPLTASDVAAEYHHIADPANKSPLRPSLLSHRRQPRESHTRHPRVSQTPRTARSTRSRR